MAKIAISCLSLNPARTGGAETYLRELLTNSRFRARLAQHQVFVFVGDPADPVAEQLDAEIIRCPVDPARRYARVLWEQWNLPRRLNRIKPDLIHLPYSNPLSFYSRKALVTVHDTLRLSLPQYARWPDRCYHWVTQPGLTRANTHAIAISQSESAILQQGLGLPTERIHVVYHGAPNRFQIEFDSLQSRAESALRDPFLLWAGRPYPQKNVSVLIQAMSELSKRRVGPLKLKLLGITEPELSKYRAEAAELGVSNLVDLPGRLPDDELQAIFQAAWAYVLPSLYEGFGIPILEAQAAGALLIASDLPIMHEVSGEAACFVKPPASPGAWADAIERMLLEPNQVQSLRTAGWKNAQQFTWDRAADATVDVYEKLVS